MTPPSAFEDDIENQPAALLAHASTRLPSSLRSIDLASYSRVILTGMGASHYAAIPTWRRLVAHKVPVWWVSTSELLDAPGLVTPDTLVWATSQSGRSGELVALVERLTGTSRPRTLLAVTNEGDSPLGEHADIVVDIACGPESSVSTKSYVNTLAAHHRTWHLLTLGTDDSTAVVRAASDLAMVSHVEELSAIDALVASIGRVALVGTGDDAATALVGALVLKEAAKVSAQGYIGGEFRHGPIELAGPGLLAVLFGPPHSSDSRLSDLAADLRVTGATVLKLGNGAALAGVARPAETLSRLVTDVKLTQLLSVLLARARGLEPGRFTFGSKITQKV